MTIDAHLHLWNPEAVSYPWLTDALAPINRPFAIEDAEPLLQNEGVDHVVLVQAANSLADSSAMFAVDSPYVAGVVAWVDLLSPDEASRQLDEWSANKTLVGIRHLIHDEPDADWLAREQVHHTLNLLSERGLSFDVIGVLPRHLEHAITIATEIPELTLVIDHLGTPPVHTHTMEPWSHLMASLARRPNVFAKLSGLTTLDEHTNSTALQPYVEHALNTFGPERLIFGGDWPVSTLATDYEHTLSTTRALLSRLSASERDEVFHNAAVRAYKIPVQEATTAGRRPEPK